MALATLSIDLEARLAKFEEGMNKAAALAEKNAEKSRAAWASAGAKISSVAGGIAGAFAGFSLVEFVKSNADAIDALNDVADATGASIENISALDDLARRTGTNLDTVSSALIKFNRELMDSKPDSGTAQALHAIGVSADELRKLDPAEALRVVAQALAGFADDGNKARLVQELFGKSVKEVAPFLKDLGEASKLSAKATEEQAAEAEKFNKQLFELQANSAQAAQAIVSKMLPALNNLFDAYKQFGGLKGTIAAIFGLDELSQLRSRTELLNADVTRAGDTVDRLAEAFSRNPNDDLLGGRLEKARARLHGLQKQAADTAAQLALLANGGQDPANYGNEGRNFEKRSIGDLPGKPKPEKAAKPEKPDFFGPDVPEFLKKAQAAIDGVDSAKVAELREQLVALINIRAASGGGAADEAILKIEEELGKFNPAAIEAAANAKRLNEMLDATESSKIEQARADMELLAKAFEAGTITAQQFNEAATARLNLGASLKPEIDEMDAMIEQFGRNVQDALGNTVERTLKGDFDNIGKLWADLLIKMASQGIAADLGNALFGDKFKGGGGALGGLFGAFAGIGASSSGGEMGSLFDLFSSFGGSFFANGGDHGGGLRIVGERGPELEATGASRIWSFDKTKAMLGGGSAGAGGKVTIINQTTGRVDNIVEQRLPEGDRVLILQEARQAVAADLLDPNSRISRNLGRGTKTERRR